MVGIGATSRKALFGDDAQSGYLHRLNRTAQLDRLETAEYVAASKAIVNEAFCFQVPGNFRAGVNYLPFTDVEGCLAQVEALMEDPERTYRMAQANRAYYLAHLRPDRLMANALAQAFEDSNSVFRERWTEMDTQSGFLRDNSELLTDTKDSLKQQYMELEDANPAGAISDYMFARYCYDTALKVGNSVLSQSLMDYMNF